MYCINCGSEISPLAVYCPMCGARQKEPGDSLGYQGGGIYYPPEYQPDKKSGNLFTRFAAQSRKKKLAVICGAAGVLLLTAGIIIVLVLVFSGGSGSGSRISIQSRAKTGLMFETENDLQQASFDYMIMTDSTEKYGAVDYEGKTTLPFEYDYLSFIDNNLYPDILLAKKGEKYGLIKATGEELLHFDYDRMHYYDRYGKVCAQDDAGHQFLLAQPDGKVLYSRTTADTFGFIGMTSDDVALLGENNVAEFIRLSDGKVINRITSKLTVDCSIMAKIVIDGGEYSYYQVIFTVWKDIPGKILPELKREFVTVDSNGNRVDAVEVKNKKGQIIARFDDVSDLAYGKLLTDDGWCLIKNKDWSLENLQTNEVAFRTDESKSLRVYEEDELIAVARTQENASYQLTVYDFHGKKLFEKDDIKYNLCFNAAKMKQYPGQYIGVVRDISGMNLGATLGVTKEGVYLHKVDSSSQVSLVLVTYDGREKEVTEGEAGSSYYNLKKSGLYTLESDCNKYAVAPLYLYFCRVSEDAKNASGDIFCDGKIIGHWPINSSLYFADTVHGICCQVGKEIYWYNRKG